MVSSLSDGNKEILFLLLLLVVAVPSFSFDYYANPVTAISAFGFPEETQVLPDATLRTHCGAFQILPSGTDAGTSYSLSLENGRYPIVQFKMRCAEIDADVSLSAAVMPRSHKVAYKASTVNLRGEFKIIKIHNMINFIRLRLSNASGAKKKCRIRLAYKLGAGIPMKVDYQSTEFIYYDWKGRNYGILKDNRLYGDARDCLFACSQELFAESGGAELRITIPPGACKDAFIFLPYFPMMRRDAARLLKKPAVWENYAAQKRAFWDARRAKSLAISVPEKKPLDLFYASQWYLMETCLDHIGKRWILRANPFQYDQFYIRDGTHEVRALDLIGEHKVAEKCLNLFLESRDENGRFASQPSQYDANGMALYALGQHFELTGDTSWAKRIFPIVKKSIEWAERYRNGGLLPATAMNDNEQVKDAHIVGHNLWALAGLEEAVAIARGAGHSEDAGVWKNKAEQFRATLNAALSETARKNGGFISPAFEGKDAEAFVPGRFGMRYGFDWGNLALVYASRMLKPDDARVTASMKFWRSFYGEGLFPYPERGNENQLHPYLSMDITQTSLIRGEYYDVLNDFYVGYLLHTTNTQGGCERFDRRTHQFIPESNLTPHGTFAAKYIELFRNFFVREDGDVLHLCSFLAPQWCVPGATIRIQRAPTYFGTMSFILTFSHKGNSAHLQICPPQRRGFRLHRLKGYKFHIPPFLNLTNVVCDGKQIKVFAKNSVELPATARSINVSFESLSQPQINYTKTVERYKADLIK